MRETKSVGSQSPRHTHVLSVHSRAQLVRRGLQGPFGQGDFWWQCRRDRGIQWMDPVAKDQRGNKFMWNRENWQWPLPSGCQLWELLSSNCSQGTSQQQDGMNPLPETLRTLRNDKCGQAGESEPWDAREEQWETTMPSLCGRASHTPWDGLQGRDWAAPCRDGRVQLRSTRTADAPTHSWCLDDPPDSKDFSPLWISLHLCQCRHAIYCLHDARAAAGGCKHCSRPQNSKVKPCWARKKHSGFPEHSTHCLWAF